MIDPERVDRYALVNATMVDHICRDHAARPVAQLEQMLAGYVERVFSRSPMQTWSVAACRGPHELEQMLAVLRGWVWGMEHSGEASIRTMPDLSAEQRHRALDAVRGAIDKWLFGLGWDEHLHAGGSPDRQGSAELWCEMLRCWRSHPASRDGLVDDPDELLPPPALRALWHCAETPGSWPSEAELRANRRDLLVIFDRCLSAYAIEGVQRETLQLALRAQIEKALRPDRGRAADVDMAQESM